MFILFILIVLTFPNSQCCPFVISHSVDSCTNSQLCVSVRDYYCYKFQMRRGVFNTMLYDKRLFQQYVVDMYIKVETSRLDYIKKHQKQICADLYQGVVDSLQARDYCADAVGKWTIGPSSFIGGRRDRRRRYLDAMTLVQKYVNPVCVCFFI